MMRSARQSPLMSAKACALVRESGHSEFPTMSLGVCRLNPQNSTELKPKHPHGKQGPPQSISSSSPSCTPLRQVSGHGLKVLSQKPLATYSFPSPPTWYCSPNKSGFMSPLASSTSTCPKDEVTLSGLPHVELAIVVEVGRDDIDGLIRHIAGQVDNGLERRRVSGVLEGVGVGVPARHEDSGGVLRYPYHVRVHVAVKVPVRADTPAQEPDRGVLLEVEADGREGVDLGGVAAASWHSAQ
eukprot:766816-Hanusia_phi.AAC.5